MKVADESPDLVRLPSHTFIALKSLFGDLAAQVQATTPQHRTGLSQGFALIDGDMVPWQVLSKFYGTGGVPVTVKGLQRPNRICAE